MKPPNHGAGSWLESDNWVLFHGMQNLPAALSRPLSSSPSASPHHVRFPPPFILSIPTCLWLLLLAGWPRRKDLRGRGRGRRHVGPCHGRGCTGSSTRRHESERRGFTEEGAELFVTTAPVEGGWEMEERWRAATGLDEALHRDPIFQGPEHDEPVEWVTTRVPWGVSSSAERRWHTHPILCTTRGRRRPHVRIVEASVQGGGLTGLGRRPMLARSR
jgi:hypothetical protein